MMLQYNEGNETIPPSQTYYVTIDYRDLRSFGNRALLHLTLLTGFEDYQARYERCCMRLSLT